MKKLYLSGLVSLALSVYLPASLAEGTQHKEVHWGYAGVEAPKYWGTLSEQFATCGVGTQQSPINIVSGEAKKADLKPIAFNYLAAIPLQIQNNGHTIYVAVPNGGNINVAGETYNLEQFHFHAPSEHQIDGKAADIELHFVHKNKDKKPAVVGVLFNQGETANPALEKIWSMLPKEKGDLQKTEVEINPNELLPLDQSYYTYSGSLTVPPCGEGVTWLVLKNPVSISAKQAETFKQIYADNARPVQPLNDRSVESSH